MNVRFNTIKIKFPQVVLYSISLLIKPFYLLALLFTLPIFYLVSCGGNDGLLDKDIAYQLDRTYTNTDSNVLRISSSNPGLYKIILTGQGFYSSLALGQEHNLPDEVVLNYDVEGIYTMGIVISGEDGVAIIDDVITWEYSTEVPARPLVKFSEVASKDQELTLILSDFLSSKDREVWIEGDLEKNPQGSWYDIPPSLVLNIRLSAPDGKKILRFKYRNIYGTESVMTTRDIIKKYFGPKNCAVLAQNEVVNKAEVRLQLSVENDGDMFYRISGDINKKTYSSQFSRFQNILSKIVQLDDSEQGLKNLTIEMKDIAGNVCPTINVPINYDKTADVHIIEIKDKKFYTDEETVILKNNYVYLEGDKPEMKILGSLVTTDKTFEWVPYEEEVEIQLRPSNGMRYIFVEYRYDPEDPGSVSPRTSMGIMLKPVVVLFDRGGYVDVYTNKIDDVASFTITGCDEEYNGLTNDDYVSFFKCTNMKDKVTVKYLFSDLETTLELSETRDQVR